ncbi:MAG: aldo/keto reductase [Deltaproteobacteria bacterium]|nr:aldo/keto reductase [Deltaproteobacteria bacterium]
MLSGYATLAGTDAYRQRFAASAHPLHFRRAADLWLSSIGLGTYLGDPTPRTDALYTAAIRQALAGGCNVLDAAINYRHQRSERVIGQVLTALVREGLLQREEIVVATKGGYIAFDGDVPPDPRAYVQETFIKTGLASADDIVEWNCIAPRYLENQIECSRRNLNLDCLDIYYLHNPEAQLQQCSRSEFSRRIEAAFTVLEAQVASGKIRRYGTATWNGYRQQPTARDVLFLPDLLEIAERVGGQEHHFKIVQLPYNLGMTEALTQKNQRVGREMISVLEAAHQFGITVMASASILQGRLAHSLPTTVSDALSELQSDAQRALQFTRSTPGITTALVGMKSVAHVEHNLVVAKLPPASLEQFHKLFRPQA